VILRGHLGKLSTELCEKCLCSSYATIRTKQKIHRLAVFVDSAIEITPLAPNDHRSVRPLEHLGIEAAPSVNENSDNWLGH
jgi:hypothetical protein